MLDQYQSNGSLVVVGVGVKFLSHLTVEARANIEQADKVLYLLNEPAMKEWVESKNSHAESLDGLYFASERRQEAYQDITDYIISNIQPRRRLCVVLYGHPAVFAKPALDAVRQARARGCDARLLPAISAEDCLFSDLLIDPGSHGCLSIEATDLLIHQKKIDTSCHLIIWQASVIGALGHADKHDNRAGQKILANYLMESYHAEQTVVVYVAAQYPGMEPAVIETTLARFATMELPRLATLYLPPPHAPVVHENMLKGLLK